MNPGKIIGGIIVLLFCIAWMLGNKKLLMIERYGVVVKMQIVKVPAGCATTKIKHFMKVSYKGRRYPIDMAPSDCGRYAVGDSIDMRYLAGIDDVLYPRESVSSSYILMLVIALLSIVLILFGVFSKKKTTGKQ